MTLPALPEKLDHLTLTDIDEALLAAYEAITPDEVVALAQWWTLWHLRATVLKTTPREEIDLLGRLGRWREAMSVIHPAWRGVADRFDWLLHLYQHLPHKIATVLDAVYTAAADGLAQQGINGTAFRTRYLRMLLNTELDAGRYEAALHIARQSNRGDYHEFVRQIILRLLELGDFGQAEEYVRYMSLYPAMGISHLEQLSIWTDFARYAADRRDKTLMQTYVSRAERAFTAIEARYTAEQRADIGKFMGKLTMIPTLIPYRRATYLLSRAYLEVGWLVNAGRLLTIAWDGNPSKEWFAALERGLQRPITPEAAPIPEPTLIERLQQQVQAIIEPESRSDAVSPVLDALRAFWDVLPPMIQQHGQLALTVAGRMAELGDANRARLLMATAVNNTRLRVPVLKLLQQLKDRATIDELIARDLTAIERSLQPDNARTGLTTTLLHLNRVDDAERLARDCRDWNNRYTIYTEIVRYLIQQGALKAAIARVETWLLLPAPTGLPPSDHQRACVQLLLRSAEAIAPHDNAQAHLWLNRAAELLRHLAQHPAFHTWTPLLVTQYVVCGNERAARIWRRRLKAADWWLKVYYRVAHLLLNQGKRAAALEWLNAARSKRQQMMQSQLRDIRRFFQVALDADNDGQTPPIDQLARLKRRDAERVALRLTDVLPERWESRGFTLEAFLGGLALSRVALERLEPGLYQRVMCACITVMSAHYPEWLKLARQFRDKDG